MEDTERWMGFISVLGMPTSILKYGNITTDTKHLFLIIPGNPGVVEYYDHFLRRLFLQNEKEIPVWGISHAGHVVPVGGNQALYKILSYDVGTLQGQIRHKISFMNEHIPKHVRVFLVGHSIGCYMNLKIMDQSQHTIERCFQLFPTIERMAQSPNGRVYTPMLKYFRWLAYPVLRGLSLLPISWKERMIKQHFSSQKGGTNAPKCIHSATLNFISPFAVSNSLFMAHQEMKLVDKLDEMLVDKHLSKLSFYFGQEDDWCPQEYYRDLKEKFPEGDIKLCCYGYSHAFVVDASTEMADIVRAWVKSYLYEKEIISR